MNIEPSVLASMITGGVTCFVLIVTQVTQGIRDSRAKVAAENSRLYDARRAAFAGLLAKADRMHERAARRANEGKPAPEDEYDESDFGDPLPPLAEYIVDIDLVATPFAREAARAMASAISQFVWTQNERDGLKFHRSKELFQERAREDLGVRTPTAVIQIGA